MAEAPTPTVASLRQAYPVLDQHLADLEATAAEAVLRADRMDVGLSLGLPGELARRVRRDTRDEVVADAERLADLVGLTVERPVFTKESNEGDA